MELAIPVGISFYSFHGLSYILDIYRKWRKPVRNFADYAVFVSFFPLLVAGPIERAGHLLPQIQSGRKFNYRQEVQGCRLILWGMFKKVVIADSLAVIVQNSFQHYANQDAFNLIVGIISFSFQIYGDFCGYSDIAVGSAKLLGFEISSYFRFPYFSRNLAEFWRRWHISLSSWFRDYLYIPLAGSGTSKLRTGRNIFIVFLVGGFWHGANWNFIVWGAIHALGFLALLLLKRNRRYVNSIVAENRLFPSAKKLIQMILTFLFVAIAWVFFRINSFDTALDLLKRICLHGIQHPAQFLHPYYYGFQAFKSICLPLLIEWRFRTKERDILSFTNTFFRRALYPGMLAWILLSFTKNSSFINFQF